MNNLFRLLIALIAINLCTIEFCFSQKITIQGKVSDISTGEGLPGVNVYVESSPIGTITDMHGHYKLEIDKGTYIITYSFLGYDTRKEEVTLHDNVKKDIGLSPANMELEEVVVTSQRKFFGNMEFGRELPSIGIVEIAMQNVNMASDVLHAKIPGVWATKTSGAPGDHQKIRIRGQTSFFASAEPLYVIDGVPVPIVNLSSLGISHLNVHDIENITVLRDASSASLYGYQGGNGVVLIDTKKGGGENQISFLTRIGYQQIPHFYDLYNSAELIQVLDSARSLLGSNVRSAYPNITDTLCSRDWQREIFTTGRLQEYQLSSAGKLGKTNFYISGNYTDHTGIVKTSAYERYTGFARLGRTFFGKLAVNIGYRTTKEENRNNIDEYRGNELILKGVSLPPSLECTPYFNFRDTLERGHPYRPRTFYGAYQALFEENNDKGKFPVTPEEYQKDNSHSIKINSSSLDFSARLQFNDHWSLNLMESAFVRKSVYDAKVNYKTLLSNQQYWPGKFLIKSNEDVLLANHQLNISYSSSFLKNNIGIVAAHRYYIDNLWWQVDTLKGKMPDHYSLKNSMAAYGLNGAVVRKLTSYLVHVSYDFDKRLFISGIGHWGRVKEGLHTNYYTFFPSLAIGWDIANEPVFRKMRHLSKLMLYYNVGTAGNYPLNGLANDLYDEAPYTVNGLESAYPVVHQFANHHIKHEQTFEQDFGLNTSFLDQRVVFNTTVFNKRISNMLIMRDIPYYFGGGKIFLNIGQVNVTGYELSLEIVPIKTKNWIMDIHSNYYSSKQKIIKLSDGQDMLFHDNDLLIPDFILKEGESLGNFYGYRFLGKATENDPDDESIVIFHGDKYLNVDSLPGLSINDKVVIGNSIPKHNFNFSTSLKYKFVGLDIAWYAVLGIQKYNATHAAAVMTSLSRDAGGYVSNENKSIRQAPFYESDVFVQEADFLRLKRVTIFYAPQQKLWGHVGVRVALSVENLATITKYEGYDPEATIFTDNNFSDNGIDRGAYPTPKSIFLTLELRF